MEISVIIVNYNVEHFLDQCLASVFLATKNVEAEVFVVDNISVDGSVQMVKEKYPEVKLIENQENVGFSRANNQAMRMAQGRYVLLLNPDTVVEEDTFRKTIDFMNSKPDCGGLGVKMIDGKGVFLPESKRGLPTPAVAFYKIFGLSSLFPKSRRYGRYHLGYLDKEEVHEIEILSGAYMMMRKEALNRVGLLDESFFMYGEDIDLSYRIILRGYKNYYFPGTKIIHYKGESTKKSSVNYVFVFYNAMIIFAEKHFSKKNAKTFSFLINIAIYLRAGVAILMRFLKQMMLPFMDCALILIALFASALIYGNIQNIDYSLSLLSVALPIYAVVWVFSSYLMGAYDKPVKIINALKGVLLGSVLLFASYAFLSKEVQFSRFVLVFGALASALLMFLNRKVLSLLKVEGYLFGRVTQRRFLIVADEEEEKRVLNLLKQTANVNFHKRIDAASQENIALWENGNYSKMSDYIYINKINEVVFSAKNLSSQLIIDMMSNISVAKDVDFKIVQPDSMFLIGSNSIHTSGDMYLLDLNNISSVKNRRIKRVFDVFSSIVMLLFIPFSLVFFGKKTFSLFAVLVNKKTWIGFDADAYQVKNYDKLNNCVYSISEDINSRHLNKIERCCQVYTKDYSWYLDFKYLMRLNKTI